ncbi:MAG TPA: sugar transferase [Candidatus Saccharimonadales bacterium]|nr:sugar transferase [Candidatus Saccharimonadales bacterium]
MKNNVTLIYNSFLVLGDVLALVLAFITAYLVRAKLFNTPVAHPIHITTYLLVFIGLLPFWIIIFALIGLYDKNIYEKRFSEIGRLLIGSFLGMLFVIFWNFLSKHPIFPAKLVPIFGFIFGFIYLLLIRSLIRFVRTILFSYNVGITNIVLIGDTGITDELAFSLFDSRVSGYRVVGVVGNQRIAHKHPGLKVFGSFSESLKHIKADDLQGIIQTELYSDEEKNREILDFAQENHILYRFVPGNSELFVGNIDVELFRSAIPVIVVHQTALFGWGRIVKRLFDLLFGGLCLIIASPFMIITALLIKLSSPRSPILFKHERLSRFNNRVGIYKFRTFKPEYNTLTPEEAFTKMGRPELIKKYREKGDQLPNNPMVSRLGQVLRSLSLDEVPQLINVVKGDISLVGPRALVDFEMEKSDKKNLILSVKSGLTGLAQVSGRRDISFEERRKLDLYYVQNWSFWLDLTILAKTFRMIVKRTGAI